MRLITRLVAMVSLLCSLASFGCAIGGPAYSSHPNGYAVAGSASVGLTGCTSVSQPLSERKPGPVTAIGIHRQGVNGTRVWAGVYYEGATGVKVIPLRKGELKFGAMFPLSGSLICSHLAPNGREQVCGAFDDFDFGDDDIVLISEWNWAQGYIIPHRMLFDDSNAGKEFNAREGMKCRVLIPGEIWCGKRNPDGAMFKQGNLHLPGFDEPDEEGNSTRK